MKFKLIEVLSRQEIEQLRLYIARLCSIPSAGIMIFNNGHFEIHQVDEISAGNILARLQRDPKIKNPNKTSTTYDFSHYVGIGLPKQKYTITGEIDFKSFLNEFLSPILEENEQYHIRYKKENNKWKIQVLDSSDNEVQKLYCNSLLDRDRELNYLKNDYQTMDCCEYK